MAARAPSDFTKYVDHSVFMPRKSIIFTQPDKVLDDQEFIIDVPRIIVSATWRPIETTAVARTFLRSLYSTGRDLCGLAASELCDWAVLAWSDSAINFSIELYGVGSGAIRGVLVSSSQQSKIWRGWVTGGNQILSYTDGTEEEFQLGGFTAGVGGEKVYIAGLAILSP